MNSIGLSWVLLITLYLGKIVTGQPAACQSNCCETDYSCCGATCVLSRQYDPEICAPISNGCCRDPANECATDPDLPKLPPTPPTRTTVTTDGKPPPSPPVTLSSGSNAAPPSGPCQPDCCTTGSFCCGSTCSANRLKGFRDCPDESTCCSNSLLICSNPASGDSPEPAIAEPSEGPSNAMEPSDPPEEDTREEGKCSDGCAGWWGQCGGGSDYKGPGCCTAGSSCKSYPGKEYSQCLPTREVSLCPDPPSAVGAYCQCGENQDSINGKVQCRAGLSCEQLNPLYSQCRPSCVGDPES